MMKRVVMVGLVSVAVAVGCGKSDSGGEGPAAKGGAPTVVSLDTLGLKAEVPAGAKVEKAIMGDGQMIQGPDLVVTVEVASDSRSKTLEDEVKDSDMYSPKNAKSETLPDGWAYSFENKGSMGANHFVKVRREIGGKSIWCETTSPSAAGAANALAACKSLKP